MQDLPELPSDEPTASEDLELPPREPGTPAGMAARLMAIGRDCTSRLTDSDRALDYDSILFDELGLPK